jgi:hypothetical protein
MDSDQSGASCHSASQQAACSLMAADRVQDRREGKVQRYYGVSHGTDQNVLNCAKRLIPGQDIGVLCSRRRLGSKREEGGSAGGGQPSDVRFRDLFCCDWNHDKVLGCGYMTNSLYSEIPGRVSSLKIGLVRNRRGLVVGYSVR